MNGMPRQWAALGRVLLFLICCAIVLAAIAPFASTLPVATQGIVIGTVASLGAFALTVLFLRWDGLRLNDIGAAVNGRSGALYLVRCAASGRVDWHLGGVWLGRLVPVETMMPPRRW